MNFTKEELYKIEECINGDGDSYGDPVCESILKKIESCSEEVSKWNGDLTPKEIQALLKNLLTEDQYRAMLFLVTYADLGKRTKHGKEFRAIKLKLQNQLAILEHRELPNK
jgi:hypothetical protein